MIVVNKDRKVQPAHEGIKALKACKVHKDVKETKVIKATRVIEDAKEKIE